MPSDKETAQGEKEAAEEAQPQQGDTLDEDGWRHQIKKGRKPKFQVSQKVWFNPGGSRPLEGPYLVSGVKENGCFTLCYDDDDNAPVSYAQNVDVSQLRSA